MNIEFNEIVDKLLDMRPDPVPKFVLDYGTKEPGWVVGIPKEALLVCLVEFMAGKQ